MKTSSSNLSRKDSLSVMFSFAAIALLTTVSVTHRALNAQGVPPTKDFTTTTEVKKPLNARQLLHLKRKERALKKLKPAAPLKQEATPEPIFTRPSSRSIKEKGESYSSVPFYKPVTLEKAGCGDELILTPETCDDGNKSNGDGCSSTCIIEAGFTCNGKQPTTCIERCGNGGVSAKESCDDGNQVSGDGCNEYCRTEPGYICTGTPNVCKVRPYCGNGIVDAGEQCDDWNIQNHDGCSSTCKAQ